MFSRLPSWILNVFQARRSSTVVKRRRRLDVETLEDRCVPSVNHAPVGVSNTVTTLENTPLVFQRADFGFSDPNDSPANNFLAVKITNVPVFGSLTNNGTAVSYGQFISVSDIDAGYLRFTPATNASGAGYAGFQFQNQDDGGTADFGVDLDPIARDMTIDVTWVNQTPSFSASNPAATYGGAQVTISGWATFDPGATNEYGQTATYIVSNISNPSFFDVAPSVSADGTLTYTLAQSENPSGSATFELKVQDNGGVANGAQDTSAPVQFTISFQNPIQDPIRVNTTTDNERVVVVGGVQTVSLRAAVNLNQGTAGQSHITFNLPAGSTIGLNSTLDIWRWGVYIEGLGASSLTIQRNSWLWTPDFSVISVAINLHVNISGVTITNGSGQLGAGINNSGFLGLDGVTMRGNNATGSGGAIYNSSSGEIAVWDSLLVGNSAGGSGGAIYNGGRAWVQFETEISGNSALYGGGVFNDRNKEFTINSGANIRNNYASNYGGGICNFGNLIMEDAFLLLNRAAQRGGGLFNGETDHTGDATLTNVDIEGNRALDATWGRGGGIYANTGAVELTGCILKDNEAVPAGGGNGASLREGALIIGIDNQIDDEILNDPTP